MVEMTGIEPATLRMQIWCSPSWATPPQNISSWGAKLIIPKDSVNELDKKFFDDDYER